MRNTTALQLTSKGYGGKILWDGRKIPAFKIPDAMDRVGLYCHFARRDFSSDIKLSNVTPGMNNTVLGATAYNCAIEEPPLFRGNGIPAATIVN